jgi:predicted metal-dependent peptidase
MGTESASTALQGADPEAENEQAREQARSLWEADRARVMVTQPFLALLAMQLDLVPVRDPRVPTAATDGRSVFVDMDVLFTLGRAGRLFLMAHEVWHCAARHFARESGRQPHRWNIAIDHEVNALLEEQGLQVPKDAVLFPELRGQNAEAVYARLPEEPARLPTRAPWDDAHGVPVAVAEGEGDPACRPGQGDWAAWPARVVSAAQQVEHQRGRLPGRLRRFVDAVRRPQLPWQEILRRFVARGVERRRAWTPPNRRFVAQGLYLPGYQRQPVLDVAVAIDTSGSTRSYLVDFLSELSGVVAGFGDYRLRLLQCDAAVQAESVYTPMEPLEPTGVAIEGDGGTDFCPVFAHFREQEPPQVLVVFTDGQGPAPAEPPGYPVLWALTRRGRRPAAWGETVALSE